MQTQAIQNIYRRTRYQGHATAQHARALQMFHHFGKGNGRATERAKMIVAVDHGGEGFARAVVTGAAALKAREVARIGDIRCDFFLYRDVRRRNGRIRGNGRCGGWDDGFGTGGEHESRQQGKPQQAGAEGWHLKSFEECPRFPAQE